MDCRSYALVNDTTFRGKFNYYKSNAQGGINTLSSLRNKRGRANLLFHYWKAYTHIVTNVPSKAVLGRMTLISEKVLKIPEAIHGRSSPWTIVVSN